MSDIEFNEEQNYFNPNMQVKQKQPAMVKLIINLGLAKDTKGANIVLLSLAVVFLIVSFFFFSRLSGGNNNSEPVENTGFPPQSVRS